MGHCFMSHFDLFVIGGGSGGVACARRAASYGRQSRPRRKQPNGRDLRNQRLCTQKIDALWSALRTLL